MQIEPEVDKAGMLEIYKKMLLIGIFQTDYGRWASNLPLHIKVLMAAMLVILLTAIASGIYFPTLPLTAETGQPIERTKPTRISWRVLHPSWIVSHKKKRKSPTQKSRQKERCFQITIWHYIQSRFSIDFTRLTSSNRKKRLVTLKCWAQVTQMHQYHHTTLPMTILAFKKSLITTSTRSANS